MSMEWYYTKDKKQVGPVSQQDLIQKISVGEVSSNDYAWHEGVTDWQPISNFAELNITSSPTAASQPTLAPGSPSPYQPTSSVNTTSGLAVASLCLGIGGFVVCGILAIPAVICGHMALGEIKRSGNRIEGKPMAIIGLVTGYLVIVLVVVGILFFALFFGMAASAANQDFSYEYEDAWGDGFETIEMHETHSSSSDDPLMKDALPEGDQ